ncbi:MAG TPA: hypothetical protein VGD69_32625 [Herpetosiphonaceae bacterium]
MRGLRVALGAERAIADHLRVHILAHAGVESEVVERPLVGVALLLPAWANAAEVARAIDRELVTAGFLDFRGRCCVAIPAEVVHGLLEIHTPYINRFADECLEPPVVAVLDDGTMLETVCGVVDASSTLTQHLQALRGQVLPPDLQQIIGEVLDLVSTEVDAARGQGHALEDSL